MRAPGAVADSLGTAEAVVRVTDAAAAGIGGIRRVVRSTLDSACERYQGDRWECSVLECRRSPRRH